MQIILLICISILEVCNGEFDKYNIMPNGMVWDYDNLNDDWRVIDQSSLQMDVPYFVVTNPKDTDLWQNGDWVKIEWSSYHHTFNTVSISLWTQSGEKVRNIVLSTEDNGKAYWLVDIPAYYSVDTLYEIRVSSTGFSNIYGKNFGYMRINHPH